MVQQSANRSVWAARSNPSAALMCNASRLGATRQACATRQKFDCSPPPPEAFQQRSGGTCACLGRSPLPRRPFRWLHVPKCGTSFANTVVHVACGGRLPAWAEMRVTRAHENSPGGVLPSWFSTCFDEVPSECAFSRETWMAMLDHAPISAAEARGMRTAHYVTLLREPLARIVSLFGHALTDNRTLLALARGTRDGTHLGCAAKMLVGRPCDGRYPTAGEQRLAHQRLEQFSFVGVTEEWELSVCAVRRLFGGAVLPLELHNVRPGVDAPRARHAAAFLRASGFRDPVDASLHSLAQRALRRHSAGCERAARGR